MPDIVIADTSCFILLSKIDALAILQKMYRIVFTSHVVAFEFGKPLPEWVVIREVADTNTKIVLELQVDIGEASAIALALEMPGSTLILDDQKARKIASRMNLSFTGTLGVLVKAKKLGYLTSMQPCIEKIKQTDFHLSADLEELVLKESGETPS